MKKMKTVIRDVFFALVIGMGCGLILSLFFGLVGALIGGGAASGLSSARSAVLLVGGLVLVASALQLLKGGNLPKEAFQFRLKKKQTQDFDPPEPIHLFRIVPRPYTTLAIGVGILLLTGILDWGITLLE